MIRKKDVVKALKGCEPMERHEIFAHVYGELCRVFKAELDNIVTKHYESVRLIHEVYRDLNDEELSETKPR